MPDKRKAPRKKFSFYMRVLEDDTEETIGHLVDLSNIGLSLETNAPVPLEKDYKVHMELTPDVSDKLFMFVTIRSKWCRTDDIMPNLYQVGFEITAISPHDHDIYQRLLEVYGE